MHSLRCATSARRGAIAVARRTAGKQDKHQSRHYFQTTTAPLLEPSGTALSSCQWRGTSNGRDNVRRRPFSSTPARSASGDSSTIDFMYFPDSTVVRPTPTAEQETLFLMQRVPIITSSSAPSAAAASVEAVTAKVGALASSALSALGISTPPPTSLSEAEDRTSELLSAAEKARKDGYDEGDIMPAQISSTSLDSVVLPLSDASDQGDASHLDLAAFSVVTANTGAADAAVPREALAEPLVAAVGGAAAAEGGTSTLSRLWDGLVEDVMGPAQQGKKSDSS